MTSLGEFPHAAIGFQLFADPGSQGGLDPSTITFKPGRITSIDACPGPALPGHTEKVSLSLFVSDASLALGTPFSHININLYNGTLYLPSSNRQLLFDFSGGFPMTFAELFLHGPQTLEDFQGQRDVEVAALADGFFIDGLVASGQLAIGNAVSLLYLPPAPGPLPLIGALCGWTFSRQLRGRLWRSCLD